jgi:hypothetical protein
MTKLRRVGRQVATVVRDRLDERLTRGEQQTRDEQGPAAADGPGEILATYTTGAPSAQEAVDVFAGEWDSQFPAEIGVQAGALPLFDDPRIHWTIDRLGGVKEFRVLELGPLEGGHTAMLHAAGATIDAVEANSRCFLKCLVTKELLGLDRARFLRGEGNAYLAERAGSDVRHDLIVASGILYHMRDPLRFLDLLSAASDRLMLWTHYYDADGIPEGERRRFTLPPETVSVDGHPYTLHPHSYFESRASARFSGGPAATANWMERDDLLHRLAALGYDRIDQRADEEHPDGHPNGPCFCVLAQRTTPVPSSE